MKNGQIIYSRRGKKLKVLEINKRQIMAKLIGPNGKVLKGKGSKYVFPLSSVNTYIFDQIPAMEQNSFKNKVKKNKKFKYDEFGFDSHGYGIDGFDKYGYDRHGFDRWGFDRKGFDRYGFNRQGRDKDGFDRKGYDIDGYDRFGYDRRGFNKKGVNRQKYVDPKLHPNLIDGKTKVYHDNIGEGIFMHLIRESDRTRMEVKFNSRSESTLFDYPECMERFLSLEKTEKLSNMEELRQTDYGKAQEEEEKKKFNELLDVIGKKLKKAELVYYNQVENDVKIGSDTEELGFSGKPENEKEIRDEYDNLIKLYDQPYFARIDYNNDSGIYIGKQEIKDKVIPWTNPLCNIYYQYQKYVGDTNTALNLVRKLYIWHSSYSGFQDLYNPAIESWMLKEQLKKAREKDDSSFLKIIKNQRKVKDSHEIIESIRPDQYEIITSPKEISMIVEGCAGSGKTAMLLHRLRYILSNSVDFTAGKVFVISSSDLLNFEGKKVAHDLNLSGINQFSTAELYENISERCAKEAGIYWSPIAKNDLRLNDELAPKFVRKVYTKTSLRNMIQYIKDVERNQGTFIKNEIEYIDREKRSLLSMEQPKKYAKWQSKMRNLRDVYLESLKECKKVSKANVQLIIKSLEDRAKSGKWKEHTRAKYEAELQFLISNENYLGKNPLLYEKGISKGLMEDSLSNLKYTSRLFKQLGWMESSYICGALDPFTFMSKYSKLIDKEDRLQDFQEGKSICYDDIIDAFIRATKVENSVSIENRYEWEVFWKAYAFTRLCKKPECTCGLIIVDEVQDYAETELDFLSQQFPRCTWNYFGDFMQSMSAKSIRKKDLCRLPTEVKRFKLVNNYRNACEITEYTNGCVGTNMHPMGLHGLVKTISESQISSIPMEDNDRVAIIIARTNLQSKIEQIKKFYEGEINIINSYEQQVQRNVINIIPISLAKGLEFEVTIVYPQHMSEHEQYVAMTRALDRLYIVRES